MIIAIPTAVVLLLLTANHLVHGFGCWGFQPGGKFSMILYVAQWLISVGGIGWMVFWLFKGKGRGKYLLAAVTAVLTSLAIYSFLHAGWRVFTSGHHQGRENLVPFLLASSVGMMTGGYKWWTTRESR